MGGWARPTEDESKNEATSHNFISFCALSFFFRLSKTFDYSKAFAVAIFNSTIVKFHFLIACFAFALEFTPKKEIFSFFLVNLLPARLLPSPSISDFFRFSLFRFSLFCGSEELRFMFGIMKRLVCLGMFMFLGQTRCMTNRHRTHKVML